MKRTIILVVSALLIVTVMFCAVGCGLFGDTASEPKNKSVTVTLDPNGGTVSVRTLIGKPGEAMELPTPTRVGDTFDKWYDDFETVDQTVFPTTDVTLTARYILGDDLEITASDSSDLNTVSSGGWTFTLDRFSDAEQKNVLLMQKYHDLDMTIDCTLEAYVDVGSAYTWFGNTPTVWYTIAGASKEIVTATITNRNDYETATMHKKTKGSELVNEGNGILRITQTGTFAATGKSKNVTLTLSMVLPKGTLA